MLFLQNFEAHDSDLGTDIHHRMNRAKLDNVHYNIQSEK